jgi:hypothetical protein
MKNLKLSLFSVLMMLVCATSMMLGVTPRWLRRDREYDYLSYSEKEEIRKLVACYQVQNHNNQAEAQRLIQSIISKSPVGLKKVDISSLEPEVAVKFKAYKFYADNALKSCRKYECKPYSQEHQDECRQAEEHMHIWEKMFNFERIHVGPEDLPCCR